jgi:hypothetical protein
VAEVFSNLYNACDWFLNLCLSPPRAHKHLPDLSLALQTAAVDVPQALGLPWWRSDAVPAQMGTTQIMITLWALAFYTATIGCVWSNSALKWYGNLAVLHTVATAIEASVAVAQAAPASQVLAQALPKMLVAGLLPICAKRKVVKLQKFAQMKADMSSKRVLRPRPIRAASNKAY